MNSSKVSGNPPFTVDCPIRTELLAHEQQQQTRDLPIETLLKIQKVSDALERLGKAQNTRDGFEKHIKTLANHEVTDKTGKHKLTLDNSEEVELAIARWTLQDPKKQKLSWVTYMCKGSVFSITM